jgi:hypothetical protein
MVIGYISENFDLWKCLMRVWLVPFRIWMTKLEQQPYTGFKRKLSDKK